jgi:hypothetical protein
MDVDTVASELYVLRPGEFVAGRDAKVAEARQAGDRELAIEIKAMRRPTVSAWVTNLLVLEQGERLEQLFSLGVALREAQTALSAEKLRALGEQRRQVIAALAVEATALAAERGQTVGSQIVAEVEQTLHAALADADAAEQVKGGRLTTALRYTGFGDAGSGQRPSGTAAQRPAGKAAQRRRRADANSDQARDAAEGRRREQLRKALQEAEHALTTATRAAEQASQRLQNAHLQREQQAQAIDQLERQLADARSALSAADRDLEAADEARRHAEATLKDARRAVQSTRAETTHR